MNPNQLLTHFDRISQAPDAIPRLRRFILDLAVRGKLVEQDPRDEPASKLLKRIQTEKTRLVKAGGIRKMKTLPSIEDEETPFTVPTNWDWVRLNDITSYIQRGKSPKYATTEGLPVISQKCVQWIGLNLHFAKLITRESIEGYDTIRFLLSGDLLWNSTGTGTIGRIIKVKEPPPKLVCDSHVTVVRCLEVDAEYVRSWLRSDHVYADIEDRAAGSTNQVELTSQLAMNQVVPLPPLAEQHRIVAKVDELMGLCDRLETAQTERESQRDRLVASSLNHLNNGADADAFQDHARFYFNHLPRLTTRPAHIKQLRQTILNLAVRGKLVPQNPIDEPASMLLERIVYLTTEGQNIPKRMHPFDLEALPFELPVFWEWVQVQDLCRPSSMITYGVLKPVWVDTGVPTVRVKDMQGGELDVENVGQCSRERAAKFAKTTLETGDLLIAKDGATLGKTAFVPPSLAGGNITQHVLRFPMTQHVVSLFVRLVIDSPHGQAWMRSETKGVALPGVNVGDFRRMPIPLPPLAEQHRIVAKVEELMTLCNQLETQLTTTQTETRHLLEALICRVPCHYIPERSYPLFRAKDILLERLGYTHHTRRPS